MTLTGNAGEPDGAPNVGGGVGAVSDPEASEGAEMRSEREYDFADDEDSEGDDEEEEEEEDFMEETEEEEEEALRSSEEEAMDELNFLRERKQLYEQSKRKQRQLIEKYFESIEKLKKVRMKNLYLQDRIHQHLVDKSKILLECREAVRARKELLDKMEAEETRPQMNHYQFETLQRELDREACAGHWEPRTEEEESPEEEEEEEEDNEVRFDEEYLRTRKCKKMAKEYMKKHEKGLSKLERLSLEHYHFDRLHHHEDRKKKQIEQELAEVPEEDRKTDNQEHRSTSVASSRISKVELRPSEVKETEFVDPNLGLEQLHREEIREEKYPEPDDEWRAKHEKERIEQRRLTIEHHQEFLKSIDIRASEHSVVLPLISKIVLDEDTINADIQFIEKQEEAGQKRLTLPSHANAPHDDTDEHHPHEHVVPDSLNKPMQRSPSMQEHHERINQRNMCRARKYRLIGIQRQKLEEFRETQETIIKVDRDDDEIRIEDGLPEFTFKMSDPSLTNMSYGEKLRKELETMVKKTKIPINLDWPLTVRGFREHFQKPNAYGRVVYTMRSDNQIKATKKTSRKYKYVLHNLNYVRQQKDVMREVHQENMEYFEISKQKWEDALEQLLVKFLGEIREASLEAVDASGKKLSPAQIDHWCRDVIKDFENLDNTAKIFYRMMNSVGITIRDLIHSESRGEGVELYEYKSLLRTNETVGAQYYARQYALEEYKQKCRDLDSVYMKTLSVKESAAESVTGKYQLSGELTCILVPKQKAMKYTEFKAKRLAKENEALHLKAGIVPYRDLVMDYENTFVHIETRRQDRMDLQLKYNSRVRQVHRIYDNMEEVQRLNHEDVDRQWPMQFDLCGLRPKTAPASTFQRSKTTLSSRSTTTLRKAKTNFLTKQESQSVLEKAEVDTRKMVNLGETRSTPGIHAIKEKLFGRPQTAASIGGRASAGLLTTVPRPATAATPSSSSSGRTKSPNLIKQPSSEVLPENKNYLSVLIAAEESKSKARFKQAVTTEGMPTASKTGILPKVTAAALVRDTHPRKFLSDKGPLPGKGTFQKSGPGTSSYSRPFTAPPTKIYESETKYWLYKYYTKKSPELEKSSKRKMDALLGTYGVNKKTGDVDETSVREPNSKYPDLF